MSLDAEPAATEESVPDGEWECMECGYIEEGVRAKRPNVCPDCGSPSRALEFFPYGDDDEEDADVAASDADASSIDG